ncbi:9372_t:CDS:1, partial [Dentiscutata heterogama]
ILGTEERAFQAERHIMLQSGKINFGKSANIKVTKVNNAKFNKKERFQKKVTIKNIDTLQSNKPKGNCFKCRKPGHFARDCYSNTKKDSFNNVNNWKLKKKRFCSQCEKPYPRHHPGCTRNNETHMNRKKVERRTVPMEIERFKKGNFSKKPYNKGKGKPYKGKFTKKKLRHYEGNEEESDEEYYSESEEETEESDNEEVITANNLHKTIQKK